MSAQQDESSWPICLHRTKVSLTCADRVPIYVQAATILEKRKLKGRGLTGNFAALASKAPLQAALNTDEKQTEVTNGTQDQPHDAQQPQAEASTSADSPAAAEGGLS